MSIRRGSSKWVALAERDGEACAWCGTTERLLADHILPRSRGGTNDLDNLQFLCFPCNSSKGDQTNAESSKAVRHASGAVQAGYTMMPNVVLLDNRFSMGARLLYGVLRSYAWQDDSAWPGQERVAEQIGVSTRMLRDYIKELVEAGLLEVRRRGRGLTNIYVLREPTVPRQDRRHISDPDRKEVAEEVDPDQEQDLDLPPQSPPQAELVEAVSAVTTTWALLAPPLIRHRDEYFRNDRTKRAIARALKTYPEDDVVLAIQNYATVLGGGEYRWSHSWTIVDFLKRGLDRFVPEADPLRNFRIRGEKFGRRDVSSRELLDLADRLQAGGADERRELEPGRS